MMEQSPKFYKLNYSGKFEEIITEKPLELFTLYTILAIYIPKEKKMYIWVSKNATQGLKKYIPQIRQLFKAELPDLRILRNITIESGEEPFNFFEKFDFSKNQLEEHVDAQENKIQPALSEINELKGKSEDLIEKEEYMEAIKILEQIIDSAQKIDDKALIKDQEDLIKNLKEKNKLKNSFSHVIEEGKRIREKYEEFISSGKFIEAHKIIDQFIKENGEDIDLKSIPEIEELLLKEENMWYNFKIEQESNIQTLQHFESQMNTCLENKFYLQAREVIGKAKDLLSLMGDEELDNKWRNFERSYFEQRGQSELFQKYDNTLIEVNNLIEDSQFEEAISKLDSLSEEMKTDEFQEHVKKIKEIKDNLIIEKQKIEDFNQEFMELDIQLKKEQEKMNFDDALFICKKIIEVATSHQKADLVEKYSQLAEQILKQVEIEIKGLDKKKDEFTVEVLNTIGEVSKLRDDGNFVEAIKKIDLILENKNDPAFADHVIKLEEIKNELIIEKESREKFSKELVEFEEKLKSAKENNDLEAVLQNCGKILELARENARSEIVEKYKQISNQIKQEIGDIQTKFEKEFKELEEKVNSEKESKNYDKILEGCEKIVELAKSKGKTDIVERYSQVIEEVKQEREKLDKFEDIKERISKLNKEGIESLNASEFQQSLDNFEDIISLLEEYSEK